MRVMMEVSPLDRNLEAKRLALKIHFESSQFEMFDLLTKKETLISKLLKLRATRSLIS